jgi:hypothetical protein
MLVLPMNIGRTSSAQILTAVFLVFGAFQPVRGDDVSEADSRSQSRTSQESAGKQTEAKVIEQPSAKTTEPWIITVGAPGWLANVSGITGFHGVNANISVDVAQILRHINVIYSFEGEVRRGRYGALLNLFYVNGQAGQATPGLVSKLDLGLQQFAGGFFASYRVIEGSRGWLDLLAGFRYTYLGEQLGLQANNMAIDTASTQLVDDFAKQLVTPGSQLRTIVDQHITDKLTALEGHNPTIPVPPLAGGHPGQIRNLVETFLASNGSTLLAAIQTGAQARVNQLKAQLSGQIANRLTKQLNRSFSFYDDWFDPVIGLRARYNLYKAFYLTAESDVGGFGIGSDVAVQVYGALGCQITRHVRAEAGYRYYYDDFRDESADGFLYQVSFHGAQVSVALTF